MDDDLLLRGYDRPHEVAGWLTRALACAACAGLVLMNVALPSLRLGGFPVRGLVASGLLVVLGVLYMDVAAAAIRKNLPILGVAAALVVIGTFVSIINEESFEQIVKTVQEVHLQAAVTLLVAAVLASLCGTKAAMWSIISIVGLSGLIAVLQLLGFEPAWSLRDALGQFQQHSVEDMPVGAERRPPGLAYSRIELATHLCLAFAAFASMRSLEREPRHEPQKADPAVIIALLVFCAMCIASGTRSPLLGAAIFFAVYVSIRRGSWLPLLALAGAAVAYFQWPVLLAAIEGAQPRVVMVDDGSATSRPTLFYYGVRLFLDNPLGYGFGFKPYELWATYWFDLYTMPSPGAVKLTKLHNYALTMVNVYGLGLLLLAPAVAKMLYAARRSIIYFIPYIAHIGFHNAGPFHNDVVLWFVVGALSVATLSPARQALHPTRGRPQYGSGTLYPSNYTIAPAGMQMIQRSD